MNNDLVLRLLTIADIPMLQEIIIDDEGSFSAGQLKRFMDISGNLAFGAILRDKIIGIVYGYSLCQINNPRPQFFVYSVAIHSSYQNRGYGSRLFQYVVNYCRENNYDEVFVPTDKSNARACRVYEKAGGKNDFDDEIIYVIKFKR